jgi:UDP-N-acetylglucosamine--N-acetylmuramyl-(pentapeptide) pyrophosphoryl-undecaprenol N-acetylglucosamine transferase
MLRVLIAGGGTGGHINPALAIAQIIKQHRPDAEFLFAGTPNGMEARLVPQAGYKLETIKIAGFQRKITPKNIKRNIKAVWYLANSSRRAKEIVKGFNPDIAIGTGGYVAGPVIRMAAKLGIPTVIHEQNAYPGVTNKLLAKTASHVMLTVKEALDYMEIKCPYTVTGLPVRESILMQDKKNARKELGFDDSLCILSFGGSLGAGCINSCMQDVIKWHTDKNLSINHIHGYGGMGKESFPKFLKENNISPTSQRLRVTEYINDMDKCLAASDIVICRAGASTLAELEAIGRPSVLIPSPIVAGNHQYHNAMVLAKAGAAVVIEQKDVTSEKIISILEDFYNNPDKLNTMAKASASLAVPDTKDRIWKVIEGVIAK